MSDKLKVGDEVVDDERHYHGNGKIEALHGDYAWVQWPNMSSPLTYKLKFLKKPPLRFEVGKEYRREGRAGEGICYWVNGDGSRAIIGFGDRDEPVSSFATWQRDKWLEI